MIALDKLWIRDSCFCAGVIDLVPVVRSWESYLLVPRSLRFPVCSLSWLSRSSWSIHFTTSHWTIQSISGQSSIARKKVLAPHPEPVRYIKKDAFLLVSQPLHFFHIKVLLQARPASKIIIFFAADKERVTYFTFLGRFFLFSTIVKGKVSSF